MKETAEDIVEEELEAKVHMVYKNVQGLSAKMKEIQNEAAKDSCLMIARYVTEGWCTRRDPISADIKFDQFYQLVQTIGQ